MHIYECKHRNYSYADIIKLIKLTKLMSEYSKLKRLRITTCFRVGVICLKQKENNYAARKRKEYESQKSV